MIGPDGVPIPIPVDETKLEMDGYFEAGYEDEYQEEYIPYQVPENHHLFCSLLKYFMISTSLQCLQKLTLLHYKEDDDEGAFEPPAKPSREIAPESPVNKVGKLKVFWKQIIFSLSVLYFLSFCVVI